MPKFPSLFATNAMKPTASRLECTSSVTILHGNAYSKLELLALAASADSWVIMRVVPSDSRNTICAELIREVGIWVEGGKVAKTKVEGCSTGTSVERRRERDNSPGAAMLQVLALVLAL